VICSWTGWNSHCFYSLPLLFAEVKVKKVVEVLPPLALVSTKKIKTVVKVNASCSTAWLWQVSQRFNLLPFIFAYAVGVDIVESLFIVSSSKQVHVSFSEDALVTCTRREDVALRNYFDPFTHWHGFEVLLRENIIRLYLGLSFAVVCKLRCNDRVVVTLGLFHVYDRTNINGRNNRF